MYDGWIKVYRQILDNPLWQDKPFSKGQAWIDILLLANHKQGVIKIKNGLEINIERGECGYSMCALSDRWGWSRNKIARFLNRLKIEKMIQLKILENRCVIKVLNYEAFQGETLNEAVNGHLMKHQTSINKNDKNERSIVPTKVGTCQNSQVLTTTKKAQSVSYKEFVSLYEASCPNLAGVQLLTEERKRKIRTRLNSQPSLDVWRKAFEKANASEFCCSGRWCNFDWFIKNDTNHVKVLEGRYDNTSNNPKSAVDEYFASKNAEDNCENIPF